MTLRIHPGRTDPGKTRRLGEVGCSGFESPVVEGKLYASFTHCERQRERGGLPVEQEFTERMVAQKAHNVVGCVRASLVRVNIKDTKYKVVKFTHDESCNKEY